MATQVVARLRTVFGVELPLRALFEAPTVGELAARVGAASGASALPPIAPVTRGDALPLSFAQERLWFLDQLEPGHAFYNVPEAVRLRGVLDVEALRRALGAVVARHEVLRTTFRTVDGRPFQVIASATAPEAFVLPTEDLSGLGAAAGEVLERRLAAEAARPFDLAGGPLIRAQLVRLGPEEHAFLLVLHHIVSDGWSMGVLHRELSELYAAYAAGADDAAALARLPVLPVQYADYAVWQRAWLGGGELERQLAYWRTQLAGAPPVLELPTDHPHPAVQTYRGAVHPFVLPAALVEQLRALGRAEGATLYMVLLAAFEGLVGRYTEQRDFVVGTPIANRTQAELEGLIGFFVNTLVLRADLAGDPSFRTLVRRVRETALGAYAHQDLPFEVLVEALQPPRDLSRSPLVQVGFVLENMPTVTLALPEVRLEPLAAPTATTKFDLTLFVWEDGSGGLAGMVEYSTDLYEAATVGRLAQHFRTLLEGAVADPERRLAALPLLSAAEREQATSCSKHRWRARRTRWRWRARASS